MNELHEFSEFQDSMRIPGGDSSARDALHFEMFALELEEEYGVQFPRRHIKDRENPLEMFERPGEFKYVFGMNQDTFRQVLLLVGDDLDCRNPNNPTALRPPQKLAIFLDFARTNGFHRSVSRASFNQICQAQATRVINYVARTIAARHVQFVTFPDRHECENISKAFFDKHKLPFIAGCIDGTHLNLQRPVESALPQGTRLVDFLNRKGQYSINCMAVCDHRRRIRYWTNRNVGCQHDSPIFEFSPLKDLLLSRSDDEHPQALCGDAAYASSDVMLTPIRTRSIQSAEDLEYNKRHKQARVIVEHAFGTLKMRFSCLLYKFRGSIENIQAISTACVVLHNICIAFQDEDVPLPNNLGMMEFSERLEATNFNTTAPGRPPTERDRLRKRIIEDFIRSQ